MTTKDKRRRRDSHVKTKAAKQAADIFVEAFSKDRGKGAATRAAMIAYPNQTKQSASQTGYKLLKDPYVQQQIHMRQQMMAEISGMTRNVLAGNLTAITFASFDDVVGKDGMIDWDLARARGIAHLIQEISITERHSKDGSSRTTTTYKMPNKLQAMDLYVEIQGWKREAQKNPVDAARDLFRIMRQKDDYRDMTDEWIAKYPAQTYNVTVEEILAGMVST